MKSFKKAVLYGLLTWLAPFFTGFFFFNQEGEYLIPEMFFKTIMIVVSGLVGTFLIVKYFKNVKKNFFQEGLKLGLLWLAINWGLDLIFVYFGFFEMSLWEYFTEIGLRYLNALIYAMGVGCLLKHVHEAKTK